MLVEEKQQSYFLNTLQTVISERQSGITTHPLRKDVFNTFRFIELGDTKVVILGRDPYHRSGRAHGLALSIRPGIATPLSLLNMYKGLENTILGFTRPNHGYLENWARQGVLLFNIVLTVRAGQAHSHASLGWKTFTDKAISLINWRREGAVFLLWGSHAQEGEAAISRQHHHVLKVPHPSPLSAHRGFFGCNHFVSVNQWLEQRDEMPIDWVPVLPAESEQICDKIPDDRVTTRLVYQALF